ncbi:hypothetical protein DL770_007562 [Monosporascus sp. CRB-9-2]|nr:hypothetical protein DL770_007562 [Monosporascus sp. CRB-9-2]
MAIPLCGAIYVGRPQSPRPPVAHAAMLCLLTFLVTPGIFYSASYGDPRWPSRSSELREELPYKPHLFHNNWDSAEDGAEDPCVDGAEIVYALVGIIAWSHVAIALWTRRRVKRIRSN